MNASQSDPNRVQDRRDSAKPGTSGPILSARWRLGFWSLIATQFQSAFNDNALKFLVIYLIVDLGLPAKDRDWLVLVIGALFALPFILFSMTGGYLADRYSKRSVTIGTKWMEIGAMLFALMALVRGNLVMEAAGVFLISSQAALFGPSKYGLLPEILPEKDLSWGNGVIELGTFIASIAATISAGFLAYSFRGRQGWSGIILLALTCLGLATSYGITRLPAANPARRFNYDPLGDLFAQIRLIRADRILSWAVVGNTYLWFLAALLQFTIVIYGHDILHIDDRHIGYLQAAVAIGIGVGSLATGYLSSGKIEYGLIPLGALGMTVFGFLSASQNLSLLRAGTYLGLLGFFGGFYAVPLNALIQHRPEPDRKGGVIAAANLLSFVGVFLAAGAYFVLAEDLHLRAHMVFFAGACMTLLATAYAVLLLPHSLLRLWLWFLSHTVYDIRVEGRDNIPERGSALFILSSANLLDVLLLTASTDQSICVFSADAPELIARSWLERSLQISPLPPFTKSPGNGEVYDPLSGAVKSAFDNRQVVCLERSALSALQHNERSVSMTELAEILVKARAPIHRVDVQGADRGVFRTSGGRMLWQKPKSLPCRVTVRFSEPLLPASTASEERSLLVSLADGVPGDVNRSPSPI